MAAQKRVLLLASIALSFFSFRYAPAFAIFPRSFFWNVGSVYLFLSLANLVWNILVYPLCLSPLRHLPQPQVSA
jgi:hypothetical protein